MGFQSLFALLLLLLPLIVTAERKGWVPITNTSDPTVVEIGEFAVSAYNQKSKTKLVFENVIQGKILNNLSSGFLYELELNAKDESVTAKYEVGVWDNKPEKFRRLYNFQKAEVIIG
ncbi:hypothetical protein ACLB2K_069084 [Fragaria x ananassa]